MKTTRLVRLAIREWRFRRLYRKYRQYTMIKKHQYCANLHLATTVAAVDGDIVECGTWRGGMIAGIAEVLGSRRQYYLCDSFQGLPPAKEIDGAEAKAWQADTFADQYYNNCAASEEEARVTISMSPARNYTIVKGWFNDTLPKLPPRPIALLRLDADWYDSTKCVLENFGQRVVPGGLLIIDDYYTWEGCTIAVNEYVARRNWRIRQSWRGGVCYVAA